MAGDDPLDALHGKADAILNLQRNNADRLDKLEATPVPEPPREAVADIQVRLRRETAQRRRQGR